LAIGAARAHVVDARERFANEFVAPALQAGALREGRYSIATALSRPLIAKHLVEIARIEGATAVAHGSTATAHDARLDVLVHALDPALTVLAPAREWDLSRADAIEYARQRGIPVGAAAERPYRIDANLWGRTIESSAADDTWHETRDELFVLTKSAPEWPDAPAYVEIEFDRGLPVKANGVQMSMVDLIGSLETIAGVHGVGRSERIYTRRGCAARDVYEAPAAVVLHAAHVALQDLVTPADLRRLTSDLAVRYADLVEDGQWYAPTRDAIDAFVKKVQERVTGVARLKLFKGECHVVGVKSSNATSLQPDSQPAPAQHTVGAGQ
jgi:argininosuccinate synthase